MIQILLDGPDSPYRSYKSTDECEMCARFIQMHWTETGIHTFMAKDGSHDWGSFAHFYMSILGPHLKYKVKVTKKVNKVKKLSCQIFVAKHLSKRIS